MPHFANDLVFAVIGIVFWLAISMLHYYYVDRFVAHIKAVEKHCECRSQDFIPELDMTAREKWHWEQKAQEACN